MFSKSANRFCLVIFSAEKKKKIQKTRFKLVLIFSPEQLSI